MRSSTLDTLTDEQKDQLYDWLLQMPVPQVAHKLAQPAPEGFGVKTYVTTLQRFKKSRWAEDAADQIEAAKTAHATSADDAALDTAIASTLKRHLFERASAPDATTADLALLARFVHRNEKLKLEVERVQISRERLPQNNRRLDILERDTQVREQTLALRREESARRAAKTSSPSPRGGDHNSRSERLVEGNKLVAGFGSHWAGVRGSSDSHQPQSDHLGPYASDLEGIRERARKHFGITPEESARRAALRKAWMARESSNSGDETHAAADPVFVRENPSPEGTLEILPSVEGKDLCRSNSAL